MRMNIVKLNIVKLVKLVSPKSLVYHLVKLVTPNKSSKASSKSSRRDLVNHLVKDPKDLVNFKLVPQFLKFVYKLVCFSVVQTSYQSCTGTVIVSQAMVFEHFIAIFWFNPIQGMRSHIGI